MMSGSMCSAKAVDGAALELLFDDLFSGAENTCLRGGADEPLYEPPSAGRHALIHYRLDYASSALHEVAHWCIAGPERRQRVDYGYWYAPDGRTAHQQQRFQSVEVRPQALEWCFSQAVGLPFRLSLDNLDTPLPADAGRAFAEGVIATAQRLRDDGMPPRAERFFEALSRRWNAGFSRSQLSFSGEALL